MEAANSFPRYLGGRLRACREARNLRQDEVATCARRWGLDWTPTTVATLETGRRALKVEEFLLLPWIAANQNPEAATEGTDTPLEWAEILKGGPDYQVRLSPVVIAHLEILRDALSGKLSTSDRTGKIRALFSQQASWEVRRVWYPEMPTMQALAAAADQRAGAERKAAQRLRTDPEAVAVLAWKLWGRSLTEERDRRVADQAPAGAVRETLQALRGHVARALIEELREAGIEGWHPPKRPSVARTQARPKKKRRKP
jgi:transcriptional regulator with XRE-family HTH domain